jgi:hypothetical protein
VVDHDFLVDEFLHVAQLRLGLLVEREEPRGLLGDGLAGLLAHGVTHRVEIRVLEGALGGDAAIRVEHQHALEHVDSQRVGLGQHVLEWARVALGHGAEEAPGVRAVDVAEVGLVGRAHEVGDELQLVDVVLPGEDGAAQQHLSKDASDGPHVDGRCVVRVRDQLGGTVPQRDDVLGEGRTRLHVVRALGVGDLRVGCGRGAGEAKVADLQVEVSVDEEVGRLEVAVDHVGGVHEVHAAEELVEEPAAVLVRQLVLGLAEPCGAERTTSGPSGVERERSGVKTREEAERRV